MKRIIHCCVRNPQERIDLFLKELLGDFSRTMIEDLIERRKRVSINGKVCTKGGTKLRARDEILLSFDEAVVEDVSYFKENLPELNILYEDEHILVINKPLGISVHPGEGLQREPTIVDALMARKDVKFSIKGSRRPGIVHRLDKWTSGCLLLAKSDKAVEFYVRAFHDRNVHKEYLALLHGSFPHSYGHIQAPVGRSSHDRKKMSIRSGGKEALTEFSILEKADKYTLMNVTLHTGRTHQIRVHFSSVGYPLVGDTEYSKKGNPFPEILEGQWLHAWKLQVPGMTQESPVISIVAPLPEGFSQILTTIGFQWNQQK